MLQRRHLRGMGDEIMPPPIEKCNPKLKLANRLNDWQCLKNMDLVKLLLKGLVPNVFAKFHYEHLLIVIHIKLN